uniref:Uncharacterized protein n=1 Tax=Arabidopsis thaliana TaxID=3702 RepID=Q56XD7_ARATH|nr:hypothetical protein [Arabidopsis thaliana]
MACPYGSKSLSRLKKSRTGAPTQGFSLGPSKRSLSQTGSIEIFVAPRANSAIALKNRLAPNPSQIA